MKKQTNFKFNTYVIYDNKSKNFFNFIVKKDGLEKTIKNVGKFQGQSELLPNEKNKENSKLSNDYLINELSIEDLSKMSTRQITLCISQDSEQLSSSQIKIMIENFYCTIKYINKNSILIVKSKDMIFYKNLLNTPNYFMLNSNPSNQIHIFENIYRFSIHLNRIELKMAKKSFFHRIHRIALDELEVEKENSKDLKIVNTSGKSQEMTVSIEIASND